jgi:hypothetical protein
MDMVDHQAQTKNPDAAFPGGHAENREKHQTIPSGIENQKSFVGFLIDVLNSTSRKRYSSPHVAPF